MKTLLMAVVIALTGWIAALADDLVIESIDAEGRIVFAEIADAWLYQVSWTTNWGDSAWHTSAPPGVAWFPAQGGGMRCVTAGVGNAACFFRVAASNYPTPPGGMAIIPADAFTMGYATNVFPPDEAGEGQLPQHTVRLSPFCIEVHEVTLGLWEEVRTWALSQGYAFENAGGGKDTNHPVHTINWYDAVKWCNARSEWADLTPCYVTNGAIYKTGYNSNVVCNWSADGYRLPTEAEWELAARGGAVSTRFPWTDYTNMISHAKANYWGYSPLAYDLSDGYHPVYNDGVSPYTSSVGSFEPNGYGLYDMAGNVCEWCWDWFDPAYYSNSPPSNPRGPDVGDSRVLRGGAWAYSAGNAGCASRYYNGPRYENPAWGFRCVRSLTP